MSAEGEFFVCDGCLWGEFSAKQPNDCYAPCSKCGEPEGTRWGAISDNASRRGVLAQERIAQEFVEMFVEKPNRLARLEDLLNENHK